MRFALQKMRLAALVPIVLLAACCDTHHLPTITGGMDWAIMRDASREYPDDCSQVPLPTDYADTAVVFIGGFLDTFHGTMRSCFDKVPPLNLACPPYKELRAYYHWEGGEGNLFVHSTNRIVKDLVAWVECNPKSNLVLVGHSYGGSAAMDVARHIPDSFKGKLILATLDPVSRRGSSQPRERAPRVDYWVNAYIVDRRAYYEPLIIIGGTWNYCAQADMSLCFSGSTVDFTGLSRHSHRRVMSMLIEGAGTSGKSVWGYLKEQLPHED